MNLGYKLNSWIEYKGRKYRLDLAFDNVLRMYDVLREDIFLPWQRINLAIELLAGRRAARLPLRDQSELLQRIIDDHINADAKKAKLEGPRTLDFAQDAALIYAAFLQAYGIDLDKERGRMDWRTFIALFQGLPDDTRIRGVMDIRQRPLPKPDAHNADQIKALMEAKAFWAIRVDKKEAEMNLQAGINRLASTLISQAKAGDGRGRR